jgi:hypothetical protein
MASVPGYTAPTTERNFRISGLPAIIRLPTFPPTYLLALGADAVPATVGRPGAGLGGVAGTG